ncbi:MAG: ATP-binding protein [Planctomycetota bacterium]
MGDPEPQHEPDSGGRGEPIERSRRVHFDSDELRVLQDDILADTDVFSYPETSKFALRLAIEEATVNALKHGHKSIPDEPIDVTWRVEADRIKIVVKDHGPGFERQDVPDPTSDERLHVPSGRGIMLIEAYMSEMRYEENGTRLTMVYEPFAARDDD